MQDLRGRLLVVVPVFASSVQDMRRISTESLRIRLSDKIPALYLLNTKLLLGHRLMCVVETYKVCQRRSNRSGFACAQSILPAMVKCRASLVSMFVMKETGPYNLGQACRV